MCRSYFRGMSTRREDNFIAGLSMGGYGAVKAAFTYPELFGGCASLSGAMDIASRTFRINEIDEWRSIFGFSLETAEDLHGTDHDLFELASRLAKTDSPRPSVFMWCGTEDRLLEANRKLDAHLNELKIDHVYRESEGNHAWKWWDLHIQSALNCLLNKEEN